jgi:hypothetical protein
MKRSYSLLVPVLLLFAAFAMAGFGGGDLKNSTGAPPGYTNSPSDAKNCSHCMGGTATPVSGWITSTVPASGYIPGQTYNIVVSATGAAKKGFEISPQDPAGNLIGTLTPVGNTKLVGFGKYVTHSQASLANPAIWTFEWTAPAASAGDVVFYASIALGKPDTRTTTYTVSQNTVGMDDRVFRIASVFPVPLHDRLNIGFFIPAETSCRAEIVSLSGKMCSLLLSETLPAGNHTMGFSIDLTPGIYILRFRANDSEITRKIVII